MHIMFENFMASNGYSSPKLKLSQPSPSSLYFEPFILASEHPTQVKYWKHADLGYFDSDLDDKAHDAEKVVLVGKNVYNWNVILFTQRIQSLATFKGATLGKIIVPYLSMTSSWNGIRWKSATSTGMP